MQLRIKRIGGDLPKTTIGLRPSTAPKAHGPSTSLPANRQEPIKAINGWFVLSVVLFSLNNYLFNNFYKKVKGDDNFLCLQAYDAYTCFMFKEMDYPVINDFVYCKTGQPDRQNMEKWPVEFNTD